MKDLLETIAFDRLNALLLVLALSGVVVLAIPLVHDLLCYFGG